MSLRVWLPLNGDLHNQGLDSEYQSECSSYSINANGKIGKCIKLSSYIDTTVPKENWDFTTNNVSFGGWVKISKNELEAKTSTYDYTSTYANCQGTLFGNDHYGGLSIHWSTNNIYNSGSLSNIYVWTHIRNNSAQTVQTSSIEIPFDVWTHVYTVIDRVNSRVLLFINGNKEVDISFDPSQFESGNVKQGVLYINIGQVAGGNARTFSAPWAINDFRLYDHALSAKEIKEISKALVLHYPLDGVGANENLLKNSYLNSSWTYPASSYKDQYSPITTSIPDGDVYTLSFEAKSTVLGDKIRTHYYSPNTTTTCTSNQGIVKTATDGNMDFTLSTSWEKYWVIYNQTSTSAVKHVICPRMVSGLGTGTVSVRNVKLEKGSKATPWIPAPSDPLYTKMGFDSTIVYDESGFGNDGTIINDLTYDSDTPRYNLSTCIATTSSHIVTPDLTVAGFANTYTFSWWQKRAATGGIMAWGFQNGNRLNLYQHVNNLFWNTGDGASNPFGIAGSLIMDNTWHYVAITGDGTTTKLYIDGEFKANAKIYRPFTGTTIYLSGWATGTDYSFNPGCLSDFRIYATALSAEDIKELYEVGMSIDNKQNIHTYEIDEAGAIGISKTGILTSKTEFIEEDDDPNVHLYKSGEVTANHFYEE